MAAIIGIVAAAAGQMAAAREFNKDVHMLVDPINDKYVEPIVDWTNRKIDQEIRHLKRKRTDEEHDLFDNMDVTNVSVKKTVSGRKFSNYTSFLQAVVNIKGGRFKGKRKFKGCKRIMRKRRRFNKQA